MCVLGVFSLEENSVQVILKLGESLFIKPVQKIAFAFLISKQKHLSPTKTPDGITCIYTLMANPPPLKKKPLSKPH